MAYKNSKFNLQILISKKGTKVVTASDLHNALKLPAYKFNSNIAKWLTDVYEFSDKLRNAQEFKDFGSRSLKYSKGKDFYLSLELAKMICLKSDSRVKMGIARQLVAMMDSKHFVRHQKQLQKQHRKHINAENNMISQKRPAVQLGLW